MQDARIAEKSHYHALCYNARLSVDGKARTDKSVRATKPYISSSIATFEACSKRV